VIKKRPRLVVTTEPNDIMQPIEIVNMNVEKPHHPWDVVCDRSSVLGSKFYLKGDESRRDLVCDSHQHRFDNEVLCFHHWGEYVELMRIRALYRKYKKLRLFCWCAPKRCHTETYKKWLEAHI